MSTCLQNHNVGDNITDNRRLIDGLRQALDMNYAGLLETAKEEWERNFAGKDPSDACVSVRIRSGDSQELSLSCAGILRKRGRSLLNGNRHGFLM